MDSDIRAATTIKPQTWFLIGTLMVTLAAWGATTYATADRVAKLEAKVEKIEPVVIKIDAIKDDVSDIKAELREMRRAMERREAREIQRGAP